MSIRKYPQMKSIGFAGLPVRSVAHYVFLFLNLLFGDWVSAAERRFRPGSAAFVSTTVGFICRQGTVSMKQLITYAPRTAAVRPPLTWRLCTGIFTGNGGIQRLVTIGGFVVMPMARSDRYGLFVPRPAYMMWQVHQRFRVDIIFMGLTLQIAGWRREMQQ